MLEPVVTAALQAIRELAASRGWTLSGFYCEVARKTYEGYNHAHEAHVYVAPWTGADNFMLCGTYLSEGRNVLEPICALIPKAASKADMLRIAGAFLDQADVLIGESYSVALFRKYGRNPQLSRKAA